MRVQNEKVWLCKYSSLMNNSGTTEMFSECQGQSKVIVLLASWDFQENNFQSVEGYTGGFEGMKGKRESL